MRWTGILLLLAGLFIQPTFLQAQRYPFVHYTPKDGLVSARARFMYQDSKGRLYITTFSGLSVYDGARFVNYTRDHGLPDNIVNDVLEMGEDSLWIMTNVNKLNCLVRGKIKDINTADGFCPVINKMLRCSNGALYALADEGLFRLENMRFVRIPLYDENGKDISRNFTRGREADNKLFLVTDPAMAVYPAPCHLVVYDLMTGKAAISKKPPDVYDVIRSPDKDILVATNYGLKNLDRTALEQGRVALTSPPPLYAAAAGKVANYLYFDRDNNLWLATAEGICKVDRQGSIRTFSMEHGLPVNLYYSVFQDKERIMWFVNEQSGLSKLSNTQVEFYSQVQKGFVADDIHADNFSDSVWMVDPEQKKILLQYPGGQKEFFIRASHPWLFRVHPGRNGNYLTGDYEVYYYDKITGKNIIPQRVFSWRDSMQGVPMVNRPVLDKNGNLLFSNDHINVVTTNKKLISYPLGYFADQFAITPQDHLWITTRANKLFLFKLHPEDTTAYFELLREYDNAAPSPRSLCYDKNGNLWIGTRDAGIYCLAVDEKFNLMVKQRFTTRTGLSDNCILSMHADESGNVWACSPVGLDKLQSKNNKWVVENITRGSNVYQNVVEVQTTRSGTHWVLTHTDVMKITPAPAIDHTNFKATILFTEIKAGRDTIGMLRHPAISYKKNDLFFQWAVPTFVDEKQTRFSYRLQGSAHDDWSEPSAESMVRFVNLAPGKYTLHVKAIFPNGLYPDTQTMYAFEVLAPWWQTWWFKALVILACGVAGLAIMRSYVRRKLEKQRILLEKRRAIEKERTRIASDMHDDLGAGLSTIRFLSEKVRRNPFTDLTKKEIDKIAGISVELVENMNEIIWAMNEQNDTLEDLLFYTRSYAKEYCEEHQLQCVVDFPENIPHVFVSGELRRNVFLTIKESLHNVVKYAEATQVNISIQAGERLTVIIKDNGKGLAAVSADNGAGGNGLRNMRRRIESVGGHFDIISENGVSVTLQVPI